MRFSWPFTGRRPRQARLLLDDASAFWPFMPYRQFARILARDIDAVRNAIAEHGAVARAEGQINRLKTLKRAIVSGRAGIETVWPARMLPLQ